MPAARHRAVRAAATSLLTVTALGLMAPLAAQTAAPDEIVVTARKREENVQEVPLSISVLGTDDLRIRNIQSAFDLATFTPNFNFARNSVGRRLDAPAIRGQFTVAQNFGIEGNVAFYVDGVYVSGTASSLSTDNVERVEVLKGPQAATFGRAAFAGAVNYITFQPTTEFRGATNLKVGEDGDYKANAWATGPLLGDRLLFAVSAGWESFDGEWQNALIPCAPGVAEGTNGCSRIAPLVGVAWPEGQPASSLVADFSPLGGESTWNVTGKLRFEATDDLDLTLKVDYTESDDDHFASLLQNELTCYSVNGSTGALGVTRPSSPGWRCGELKADGLTARIGIADLRFGANSNETQGLLELNSPNYVGPAAPAPFIGTRTETERYLLQANWDVAGWTLTGLAGFNRQELESYRDLDRSPYLGPLGYNVFAAGEIQTYEDTTFELRATSDQGERLRGTFGAFYYDASNLSLQREYTGSCNRVVYGRPFVNGQPSWTLNSDKENTALFGGLEYDITDKLSVAAETRYAKDSPETRAANGVVAKDSFYSVTPRFTVTYQATDDVNVYALAALGNKPGGFNFAYFDAPVTVAASQAALTPGADGRSKARIEEEEAWTYEIGAKTQWLDGRITANVAAYYIDWTNQAINEQDPVPWTCTETAPDPENPTAVDITQLVVRNAGESRVLGIEIQLSVAPTENWLFTFNYGLADTKLEQFNSATIDSLVTADSLAAQGLLGNNARGKQAPSVPEHTATASGTYSHALGEDGARWFFRSDYVYNSKTYVDVDNEAYIGAINLVNTRLGVEKDRWIAAVYVDNLLNEDAPQRGSTFPNFARFPRVENAFHLVPRRSRNAGLNLQYRF